MKNKALLQILAAAGLVVGLVGCEKVSRIGGEISSSGSMMSEFGRQVATAFRPIAYLEMLSVINTDKTLIDHVSSWTSGQDCSTLRAQQGGYYCMEHYENRELMPTLYCYRSLGSVTCYNQPSPNPGDRLVGIRPGGPMVAR